MKFQVQVLIAVSVLVVLLGSVTAHAIPGLSEARQAVSAAADAASNDAAEDDSAHKSTPTAANTVLPFPVLVDGDPAQLLTPNATYAVIRDTVTPYVEVTAKAEADMMIINVFPCDSDGNVESGVSPAVIIGQGTTTVKLSDTMDKQPLEPGDYIMNIVIAKLGTARVKFEVE
jgi:hypothetical protein